MIREKKKASAVLNFGEFSRRQLNGLLQPFLFPKYTGFSDLLHENTRNEGKIMNEILNDWENYVQDINNSLVEREQIINAMEILQEKAEDIYKYIPKDNDRKPAFQLQGLTEIILMALKNNYDTDADSCRGFEHRCWKEKEKLKETRDD